MNKMDLNVTPEIETEVEKPANPWIPRLKKFAVFAAPLLVLVGGAALFTLMTITAPKPDEKAADPRPPAVQFAVAHARPTTISITVQGPAQPRFGAVLAAQVAGRIVWVSPTFVEGGSFREGEAIARIDQADYQLAVVRARSQVAQAEEGLAREEAEGELARQDWEVLGRGADASPLTLREPQLAQARAALAAARAQLRSAELDLSRTNIRAPFTGRVHQRRASIGDYVGPGAAVADVFSTEVMEIRVPLTDANLAALLLPIGFTSTPDRPGPAAHITGEAGAATHRWEGRLSRIEASVDARTRLVYGVIEVRDPFSARHTAPLAPGMFVTAVIEGANEESLVAAPRSALKRNEFVIAIGEDDTISVRNVRPAQTTADEVLFREGVADGERLVVSHMASPREGMEVTPINRAGEAPAAAPAPAEQPLDIRD